MKKSITFLTVAVLTLPAPVWADVYAFVGMPLTASQESSPPTSAGYGSVTVLYETTTKSLLYSAVYQLNAGATATASHFHGAADLGASAPVAIALPTQPTGSAGKLTGAVTLTAAQETDLLAGKWYLNIHSSLAAGGELRAQLIENSATNPLPLYSNGALTIPVVLVPGITGPASYSVSLTYPGTGNDFTLSTATPFR
ncbi:MAG: hypothetical protein A3G26_09525 [Betaproteobacteria bacterium RIFCSPLOWO2_12_FULL_65_110]|nr:MAG: hypothetical protein A3H33_11930 [Betaproteobacteria bacterium RIFCSPLOWO2_02_FULL_65_20]OGA40709.1 MAG: hypothetical protein A3G26_09525 [Betaproteobacteria bacterium RIFCSPLOWO2_12_FULL_65_110]